MKKTSQAFQQKKEPKRVHKSQKKPKKQEKPDELEKAKATKWLILLDL